MRRTIKTNAIPRPDTSSNPAGELGDGITGTGGGVFVGGGVWVGVTVIVGVGVGVLVGVGVGVSVGVGVGVGVEVTVGVGVGVGVMVAVGVGVGIAKSSKVLPCAPPVAQAVAAHTVFGGLVQVALVTQESVEQEVAKLSTQQRLLGFTLEQARRSEVCDSGLIKKEPAGTGMAPVTLIETKSTLPPAGITTPLDVKVIFTVLPVGSATKS
jgi:hypothetical protein